MRNESGDKLAEFCLANNLTIANTWFKHHPRNTYTWKSPGDLYRNQIDYIMISRRWKSSITDSKAYPGADCETDHSLVVAKLKVKLARNKVMKPTKRLNVKQLENDNIKDEYTRCTE